MTRSLALEPQQPYEVISITPTSQGRRMPLLQTPQPIPLRGQSLMACLVSGVGKAEHVF